MARENLPEKVVRGIWRYQLLEKERLATTAGVPLRLLYPGEEEEGGPDFRRALLLLGGGEVLRGDIEIHLRSNLWKAHGHHKDPAYKNVVLHVVLQDDARAPAPLCGGGSAPVLELTPFLMRPLEELRLLLENPLPLPFPCQGQHLGSPQIGAFLDAAGEERFRGKASSFREAIAKGVGEEVLYQGIMAALGYSRNQEAFQELAHSLPLGVLRRFSQQLGGGVRSLQALLVGCAGLLPSQRRGSVYPPERELEEEWASSGLRSALNEPRWRFCGVRPENSPIRRLGAAAHLLYRYRKAGLLEGLRGLAVAASKVNGGHNRLERGLIVAGGGVLSGKGKPRITLLGRSRAGDIAVNVLLPFYYSLAEVKADSELQESILRLYRLYPPLEENKITRQMGILLCGRESPRVVKTAQRQQGLIHLHHCFCREGKCSLCLLSSPFSQASSSAWHPGSSHQPCLP